MSDPPVPGHPEVDPADVDPPSHQDDGLDLARQAARAAAQAPGAKARARRTVRSGSKPRSRPVRSGKNPDDRDPQLLGSEVERLVRSHGWETELHAHEVFARWGELVGEEVAAHCTPESLTDARLVVRTDSTAWATQLRLLAPTLVRRLNEELGHGTVTLIEVLGPHLPSWKKGLRSTKGRGPRDTYG